MLQDRGSIWPVARLRICTVLLVVAAAAIYLTLRSPASLLIDVGIPSDSLFLSGFFAPEQNDHLSFRWSSPESRLMLHGATSAPLIVSIRLNGDLLTRQEMPALQLMQAGKTIGRLDVSAGWRVYRLLVPAGTAATETGRARPLGLASTPYCPSTPDNRVLGVPVDWIAAEPTTIISAAAPLVWTLLLTWALALLAGGAWLLEGRLWPHRSGLAALAPVCLPPMLAALCVIIWAWFARPALIRALSLAPWLLGLATLLLALVWWHRRAGATKARTLPFSFRVPASLAWLAAAGCWLAAHGLLLLPLPPAWSGLAAWLLLLAPGALLTWLLFRFERDPLLTGFLAGCGALALPSLVMLPLHSLPGPLPWWALLLASDALTVIGAVLLWRARPAATGSEQPAPATAAPLPRPALVALIALVLLAAAARLPFLGNPEFQGDEARAIVMAMGVQHGQDEILLLHRKGPVEVLLPAAPLVLTGHINELTARVPFALAGLFIVPGCFLLARRLSGDGIPIGLLAAAILSLDGFLIAFSRIVQYQSVLACMSLGAFLCCWRFYEGTPYPRRYLLAAAVLASVGLLAHYDGAYVMPALALVVLAGGRRSWQDRRQWLRGLAAPLLVGLILLLSFYLPFFTHENFFDTYDYLTRRVGQEQEARALLHNNLISYYLQVTFYNTTYQILSYAAILLAGLLAWLRMYARPRAAGWLLAALLLVGALLLVLSPEQFALGSRFNWAIVAFGLPLLGLLLFPATPFALRALLAWLAPPFITLAFLVGEPRTHFYAMHTAAALLIALIIVRLVAWLRGHRLGWALLPLGAGGIAVLLLTLPYMFLLFIQQQPEYFRSFPAERPALYRAAYGDEIPGSGYFGFPHRDGWKVIGELYRQEVLAGSYNTNQRDRVGIWYTRGQLQCDSDPRYYFLATWEGARLEARFTVPEDISEYQAAACVLVDNMRMISIYEKQASVPSPQVYHLGDYSAAFDAQPVPHFAMQRALADSVPQYHLALDWQGGVRLAGYDLDRGHVRSGQAATFSLHWQVEQPLPGYMLVVEIVDASGAVVGQAQPLCNPPVPAWWNSYYLNSTAFSIAADDLAAGQYSLRASLQREQDSEPLRLTSGAAHATIATITVEER